MARIQDIDIPHLEFAEAAAPGTPASGIVRLYAKSDGLLYSKDDAGSETVVTGGGTALTTIRGRVNADGTEAADTGGYTVAKNSTGNYTVTYGSAFAAIPFVSVTPFASGATRLAFIIATSTSAFDVITTDFAGNNTDSIFSFLAIAY